MTTEPELFEPQIAPASEAAPVKRPRGRPRKPPSAPDLAAPNAPKVSTAGAVRLHVALPPEVLAAAALAPLAVADQIYASVRGGRLTFSADASAQIIASVKAWVAANSWEPPPGAIVALAYAQAIGGAVAAAEIARAPADASKSPP